MSSIDCNKKEEHYMLTDLGERIVNQDIIEMSQFLISLWDGGSQGAKIPVLGFKNTATQLWAEQVDFLQREHHYESIAEAKQILNSIDKLLSDAIRYGFVEIV